MRRISILMGTYFRAAAGIPASINLIIHLFPRAAEQHVALAAFGGAGELANVGGFILGGVLLLAGWRWVFWLLPIVCFPLAAVAWFVIPKQEVLKRYQLQGLREEAESQGVGSERAREVLKTLEVEQEALKFDYIGSFLVVSAAVLSVFGLTDGGEGSGWYVIDQTFSQSLSLIPSQGPRATDCHPRHWSLAVPPVLLVRIAP
jgi:MFS family permease